MVTNKRAPTGAHQDNSITSKSPRPVDGKVNGKPPGRPRICPIPNRMFSLRLPVYLIDAMNELKRTGKTPSLTDFVIAALSEALQWEEYQDDPVK